MYNSNMVSIKISKSRYFFNLETLSKIATKDKLAVVLKDNAYGHGLMLIAKLASEFGIKKAVVRTANEALQIAHLFEFVLVLSDHYSKELPANIHIGVNSIEALKQLKPKTNIHLKIDTGMHRNGINMADLNQALDLIKALDLRLFGIYSHSRSGDELSCECFWQIQNFKQIKAQTSQLCKAKNMDLPIFHFANSPSLLRFKKEAVFDMARVGIAAYGYSSLDDIFSPPPLKPILSLWAEKMSSRFLKAGQKIGYGGAFTLPKDSLVSVYDIGYSDGLSRLNETHEYILPNGAKILGRVCMDAICVNSDEQKIQIFSDATNLAKLTGTIVYDTLAKLNSNIKRQIDE